VPVVSDAQFMDCVGAVIGGTGVEDFADAVRAVRAVLIAR
jgi:DNA polymerase III subunit epsilon